MMPKLTTNCSVFWPKSIALLPTNCVACTVTDDSRACSSDAVVRLSRSRICIAQDGMACMTWWK